MAKMSAARKGAAETEELRAEVKRLKGELAKARKEIRELKGEQG